MSPLLFQRCNHPHFPVARRSAISVAGDVDTQNCNLEISGTRQKLDMKGED